MDHEGKPSTHRRISESHTRMTPESMHTANGDHFPYRQDHDAECYVCQLLRENQALRDSFSEAQRDAERANQTAAEDLATIDRLAATLAEREAYAQRIADLVRASRVILGLWSETELDPEDDDDYEHWMAAFNESVQGFLAESAAALATNPAGAAPAISGRETPEAERLAHAPASAGPVAVTVNASVAMDTVCGTSIAMEANQRNEIRKSPVEPTEHMVIAGFECEAFNALDALYRKEGDGPGRGPSCREAAEAVRGIYRAMVGASAPGPVEFAVWAEYSENDVDFVAQVNGPRDGALAEARRYAAQIVADGDTAIIEEVTRREIERVNTTLSTGVR